MKLLSLFAAGGALLAAPCLAAAQSDAVQVLPPIVAAPDATKSPGPAWRYAHGSISLLGGLEVSGTLAAIDGNAVIGVDANLGFAARFVLPCGLALEPGVGVHAGGQSLTFSDAFGSFSGAWFGVSAHLGIGWAAALARNVAFTPMLVADVGLPPGVALNDSGFLAGSTYLSAGVRLPVTIFLDRHWFVEPSMGASLVEDGFTGVLVPTVALRGGATF